LGDQYDNVLKQGISLKYVDRTAVVNLTHKKIKLLSLTETESLRKLLDSQNSILLPSGLIAEGGENGQNWAELQRNEIRSLAIDMSNRMSGKWNNALSNFEEEMGFPHDTLMNSMFRGGPIRGVLAAKILQLIRKGDILISQALRFDYMPDCQPDVFVFRNEPKFLLVTDQKADTSESIYVGSWNVPLHITNGMIELSLSRLERFMLEASVKKISVIRSSELGTNNLRPILKEMRGSPYSKWIPISSPTAHLLGREYGHFLSLQWTTKMTQVISGKPLFLQIVEDDTVRNNANLQMLALESSFLY
jgi:hypothetical protein